MVVVVVVVVVAVTWFLVLDDTGKLFFFSGLKDKVESWRIDSKKFGRITNRNYLLGYSISYHVSVPSFWVSGPKHAA